MTTLEQQIKETQKQLSALQEKLKEKDKLELKGGEGWYITTTFGVDKTPFVHKSTIRRGAFRATRELAEIADKNMVTRNILEAYAMQLDPEWRDKAGQVSYVIYKVNGVYATSSWAIRVLGAVHMSKETAEILCKALNAGEITL